MNDTDINLENYSVFPSKNAVNPDINGFIKLPKRGKIILKNEFDENSRVYTIRVR